MSIDVAGQANKGSRISRVNKPCFLKLEELFSKDFCSLAAQTWP